jgi:hypothetical protein
MDTERSRRHASKLLTYPITIGGVLHQHSGLTLNNQRLTPEGSRSLAGQSPMVILHVFAVHLHVSSSIENNFACSAGRS